MVKDKKIILVYPHEHVNAKIKVLNPKKVITVVSKKEGGFDWPNVQYAPDPLDYPQESLGILQDLKQQYPNSLFVPMMEEVVLDCAFVNETIDKVLPVVDRMSFRDVLWYKHYSVSHKMAGEVKPKDFKFPAILKARASALSKGVEVVQSLGDIYDKKDKILKVDRYYIDKLRQFTDIPENELFIVETCVAPNSHIQYEINGVVCNKNVRFYDVFVQRWAENKRIMSYERYHGKIKNDIIRVVKDMITTFELDNTCFCAELRIGEQGLKVIELNLRLGEEKPDYYRLFTMDIFSDMINFFANNW